MALRKAANWTERIVRLEALTWLDGMTHEGHIPNRQTLQGIGLGARLLRKTIQSAGVNVLE